MQAGLSTQEGCLELAPATKRRLSVLIGSLAVMLAKLLVNLAGPIGESARDKLPRAPMIGALGKRSVAAQQKWGCKLNKKRLPSRQGFSSGHMERGMPRARCYRRPSEFSSVTIPRAWTRDIDRKSLKNESMLRHLTYSATH